MSQRSIQSDDIFEFAKILGQQNDFHEVLKLVANKSAQFLKADLALVLMLNPDTRETVNTVFKEGMSFDKKEYRDIHIHVGGWIISKRQPFLSHHIQRDDRFVKGLFDKVPLKSVAGVPLMIEGIVIGALILLYRESSDVINTDSLGLLENMAAVSAPFLRNVQKIRQYFQLSIPESSLILKYKNAGLYGKSPRFVELLHAIEAATKCDVRILLIGKTGTGKELIARAIHRFGPRASDPFIPIDCGAIQTNLIESELFGHKRGAFTGADSDRSGLFIEAKKGTLFMDEINNLPYDMQSKLLRVLEEGEVRPVGSNKIFKTDARIVVASSVSLKKMVDNGFFREDLFYRLHVYPIYVPDLSERKEDIPILATHFLHNYAKRQNKNVQDFDAEVMDFIKQRKWEGNIRELENFVERLVTLVQNEVSTIEYKNFPVDLREELNEFREKQNYIRSSKSLKEQIDSFEAKLIKQTLEECNWNQSKAARKLLTSESNIRYKINQFNIQRNELE